VIIDSHVHIGKTEKTERFWTFKGYAEFMEEIGIDKTVAMPNISSNLSSLELNDNFLNEYTSLTKELQDKFELLILLDTRDDPMKYLSNIKLDAVGIKYHPSVTRIPINDKCLDEFIDLTIDRKWYTLVHCGRDDISNIRYLIDIAKRKKHARFVAAHLGGNAGDLVENALNSINKNRVTNIYLDTSNGKLPWLISKAAEKIGKDKILFGSDEPYADVRVEKYIVELGEFQENIFSKNWMMLHNEIINSNWN